METGFRSLKTHLSVKKVGSGIMPPTRHQLGGKEDRNVSQRINIEGERTRAEVEADLLTSACGVARAN